MCFGSYLYNIFNAKMYLPIVYELKIKVHHKIIRQRNQLEIQNSLPPLFT